MHFKLDLSGLDKYCLELTNKKTVTDCGRDGIHDLVSFKCLLQFTFINNQISCNLCKKNAIGHPIVGGTESA